MTKNARVITTIDRHAGKVKIRRKDWALVLLEAHRALGGSTFGKVEPVRGVTVTMPLPVWQLLLAALHAALELGGYVGAAGAGCSCDELCAEHGGCAFEFGSVFVCEDGDLVVCGA